MWGFLVRSAVRTAIRSGQQPARGGPQQIPPRRFDAAPPPKRRPQIAGPIILLAIVGGCCLSTGALMMVAGVSDTVRPRPPRTAQDGLESVGVGFGFCVMPSLVMLSIAGWSMLRTRRMDRLVALAETHARLPLDVAAHELRTSRETVRSMLLDAVSKQYVRGRLDLDHGVFFSGDAELAGRQWAGQCGSCSAPVSVTLARGEPGICPFCRGPLGVMG
ncbi:MAG: hypothetical protein M3Y87_37000 [Myxococcota bacterium]|nr:hypothetical protein [Myxococcota bacterium]